MLTDACTAPGVCDCVFVSVTSPADAVPPSTSFVCFFASRQFSAWFCNNRLNPCISSDDAAPLSIVNDIRGLWREVVGDDESNTCPGLTPSRVVIDVSAVYLTNQKVVPMGGPGLRSTNPDSDDAIPLL